MRFASMIRQQPQDQQIDNYAYVGKTAKATARAVGKINKEQDLERQRQQLLDWKHRLEVAEANNDNYSDDGSHWKNMNNKKKNNSKNKMEREEEEEKEKMTLPIDYNNTKDEEEIINEEKSSETFVDVEVVAMKPLSCLESQQQQKKEEEGIEESSSCFSSMIKNYIFPSQYLPPIQQQKEEPNKLKGTSKVQKKILEQREEVEEEGKSEQQKSVDGISDNNVVVVPKEKEFSTGESLFDMSFSSSPFRKKNDKIGKSREKETLAATTTTTTTTTRDQPPPPPPPPTRRMAPPRDELSSMREQPSMRDQALSLPRRKSPPPPRPDNGRDEIVSMSRDQPPSSTRRTSPPPSATNTGRDETFTMGRKSPPPRPEGLSSFSTSDKNHHHPLARNELKARSAPPPPPPPPQSQPCPESFFSSQSHHHQGGDDSGRGTRTARIRPGRKSPEMMKICNKEQLTPHWNKQQDYDHRESNQSSFSRHPPLGGPPCPERMIMTPRPRRKIITSQE